MIHSRSPEPATSRSPWQLEPAPLFKAVVLTLLVTAAACGQAFTPISGPIYDGSGGPLLANTIYVATGNISVPAGQTLTVNSGAGIKFNSGNGLTVSGTINVNGTAGAPVRFTSYRDDTVGGDTNGNGPSSGGATDWAGITGTATAVMHITQASIRFSGNGFAPGIKNQGGALTLANVTVSNCYDIGLDLSGQAAALSVSNCTFSNNGGIAVNNVLADHVPGFTNNTASGNGGNYIRVTGATLAASRTITAANCMNGALVTNAAWSVPVGITLTLQAGVIIKFANPQVVTVDGTLNVNGTAGSPVVMTAFADDAYGGDTNNNGPSAGGATAWAGVVLHATASASVLNSLYVRYTGSNFYAGIQLDGCNATLNSCHIDNSYNHGLELSGNSFTPTVTNCTFSGNGAVAVNGVPLHAVPGFNNNSASGNGGNYMRLTDSTLNTNRSIVPANCLNGALATTVPLTVPAGRTLTMAAGTCIKFSGGLTFQVDGTLLCNGTGGNPVVFTSFSDDTIYGDTNNNGPSTGSPTNWNGVIFTSTSSASLVHSLEVRFTGGNFFAGIDLRATNLLLEGCRVVSSYSAGINFNAGTANQTVGATVSGCTVTGCGSYAFNNVPIDAVPHHLNNTASGNTVNATRITVGTVAAASLDIGPTNGIGGALLFSDHLTVPANKTLILEAGIAMKFNGGLVASISGTLIANGVDTAQVAFTSYRDDSIAGDTNGGGASSGAPTDWLGLTFEATSTACLLRQTLVRYTGNNFYAGITFNGGSPTLYTCTVRDGYAAGLGFGNSASRPQVIECHLISNGGYAIDNVPVDALAGFANNYATGNHTDIIRVVSGTPAADVFIGPQAGIAITFFTSLSIPVGRTVTILPATIVKMTGGLSITVDGALNIRGTGYEPVILTSYGDDTYGGDSNGNGPSTGNPTDWQGLVYHAGAAASSVEDVIIRNTGSGFFAAFTNQSPLVAASAVRVERAYADGFQVSALSGGAANWVAQSCGSAGIHVTGGSFPIAHATVTGCNVGLSGAGWTGTVYNSIIWGNTTNVTGLTSAAMFNSDGAFAGTNGNINADPQFLNAGTGDLHLPPTSPCIAAGNVGVGIAVAKDFDEQPRVIDSNLSGTALPEMGAFERPVWTMDVNGVPRLGATVTFTVQGPPGSSIYVLGALDGSFAVGNFGIALAGLSPLILVTLPVGATLPITIPADVNLLGLTAGIQTLTIFGANPALGSTTTLYRATVRP